MTEHDFLALLIASEATRRTNETMFQMSVQLAEAKTEVARLRAVLATAKQHACDGNWNACKAALCGTGGDA